jgi:hypothetical protein
MGSSAQNKLLPSYGCAYRVACIATTAADSANKMRERSVSAHKARMNSLAEPLLEIGTY